MCIHEARDRESRDHQVILITQANQFQNRPHDDDHHDDDDDDDGSCDDDIDVRKREQAGRRNCWNVVVCRTHTDTDTHTRTHANTSVRGSTMQKALCNIVLRQKKPDLLVNSCHRVSWYGEQVTYDWNEM